MQVLMTPPVEKEIDRILTLLRNKIREQGFTQLEVQDKLEWGRSYISQLVTKQKSLRVEQLLMILETIGVEPQEFYVELYQLQTSDPRHQPLEFDVGAEIGRILGTALVVDGRTPDDGAAGPEAFLTDYRTLRAMLRGLVQLLVEKEVVSTEEIIAATKAADQGAAPTS